MSTKNQDPKQNQTNNEESLQDDLTANKLDVKIKELEKQKLQLEIDTIRGVSKRKKWIFFSLKAAISALVAVPLFWFYYKDVYLPLSQIEHNKLLKETSKMQSEFAQLSKETNIKQHQFDSTKTAMKSKQDSLVALQALLSNTAITLDNTESKLSVLNDSLESATEHLVNQEKDYLERIEKLKNRFTAFSRELDYTKKQRDEFQKNASELEGQINSQRALIATLNQKIQKAASGILQLRDDPDAVLTAHKVKNMLTKFGFYCAQATLTRQWSAPQGKGLNNKFVKRKGGLVIHDQTTGLQWQTAGSGRLNYRNAQNYVAFLNKKRFAGYSDWRLPTLEEVMSLMTPEKGIGGLHINPVFNTNLAYLWTADGAGTNKFWFADFSAGICYNKPASDINYLRAVRSVTEKN